MITGLFQLQSLIISSFVTFSPDVTVLDAITKWHCTIASSQESFVSLDTFTPNQETNNPDEGRQDISPLNPPLISESPLNPPLIRGVGSNYIFVTDQGKLLGIITEKKIEELLQENNCLDDLAKISLSEVMTPAKIVCHRENIQNVEEIIKIFVEDDIDCLPVVSQGDILEGFIPRESLQPFIFDYVQKLYQQIKTLEGDKVTLQKRLARSEIEQIGVISLQKKRERERLVYQITSQIHNTIQLDDTLNVAVNLVRDFMRCDRILIKKFNSGGGGKIIAESVDEKFPSGLGNCLEDQCFREQVNDLYEGKEAIIVNNIYEKDYPPCYIQLLEEYQVKANLVIPLTVSGKLWGLLVGHQCQTYREWQLEDVELLKEIATQMEIAIHQSQIHEKLHQEISERIVAEKIVEEQKTHYENLMEVLPVGVFRNDLQGNCTYVNERYCEITGLNHESATGIGWQDIIHPDDRKLVFRVWQNLVNYHQTAKVECRFLRPDKTIAWGYVQCILDKDENGKTVGFIGSVTDITKRKNQENQIAESEARFQKIAATLPGILYISRQQPDGSIQFDYINRQVKSIFELTVEQVIKDGSLIFQHFHPDDVEEHYRRLDKSLQYMSLFFHELRIITPSGKLKWLQVHCYPEKLPDGLINWVGLAIDITEKKEAEIKLAKTENLFRRAEKIAKIGNWEYDAISGDIYWSDEIYRIFEVDSQGFTPHYASFFNAVHPDDRTFVEQAFQQHLKEDSYYNIVHRLLMADGRVKYVREHCETYRDQAGNALKSIGTVQDITEQQVAENIINNIIQGTSTAISGKEFFENLVTHIALSVNQPCVVISKLQGEMLESLAFCYQGELQDDDTIPLHNTPCECAMREGYYYCTEKVAEKFPTDTFLETVKAESYVGIALMNQDEILGTICVLDNKTITDETIEKIKKVLDVFAPRVVAEFMRMRAEEELQTINLTLESQVNERTKELQESQQFIKTILDTLPLPVLWKDRESKYLGCNRQFLDFVNLSTQEEIIGKNDGDFAISPEEVKRYQEKDSIVMTTGEPMLAFEDTVTVDGQIKWIDSNKVPLRNSQEEIIGVLTIFKDITEEKAIQTALEESEARWQFALDGASHGVWDVNLLTNETYYSPKFMEMLGYKVEEWGNTVEDWQNRIHPDDKEKTLAIAQQYLNGEISAYQTEHRLLCKDGSYKWILARGKFVAWDENGNPTRMIGTNTDITDRILMEQQLRESQKNLQRLVDEIGNKFVIFSHNLDTIVTYVSGGIESVFGLRAEEITGKSWAEIINWGEESLQKAFENVSLILNAEEIIFNEFDISFIHPSGEEKIVRVCHHVVKNDQGEVISIEGIIEDITESKKALTALEESEKRFRQVFSSNVIGMMFTNFEGEVITANDRFLEMVGYSREDLENNRINWQEMTPPEYRDLDLYAIETLKQKGKITPWEKEYIRKDGDRISILIGVASLNLDNFCTVCVIVDITERKRAEKALQEKTQELDRFFSLSLDLLCIASLDGHFLRLNRQWENVLGYKIEDLENSQYIDFVHPDDIQKTLDAIEHLRNNRELPSFINRYRCCDGSYRWIEWRSASDGNLIYGAAKDITEKLKAEEEKETLINALGNTNNLLKGISNAQSQFITAENRLTIFEGLLSSLLELTDSEYGFIGEVLFRDDGSAEMEETFLKIKGVPYIKTHSITNIAWNEETQKFYEDNYEKGMEFSNMNTLFGAVIMTGKPVIANSPKTDPRRGGTPDGHPPLNAFLGLPFFSKDKLIGMVGIANRPDGYDQSVVDYLKPFLVTCSNLIEGYKLDRDRRKTEQELALSNQELIRATRLKDEFLANMSHELRTPLNAILGNTEILTEQVFGVLNERQLKSVKTIDSSSSHLLSLINDILDVAKIEAGQITLECIPTDIKSLSQSALVFVQQQAQKKGIQLQSRIEEGLPNLSLDQRRIRQALINLLNNAVKFTPEGGKITLQVTICEQKEQESPLNPPLIRGEGNNIMKTFIRIAVIDTGIGITNENIKKLFKPFIQIDSALNRKYAGTGLGLSLVKQISELHGGSVGVSSEVGKGSCFYMDLPYIFASCNLNQTPSQESSPPIISGKMTQKTSTVVLLAEDNEGNILTMGNYLQAKGYEIITAKNGLEAIQQTKINHPDIIIMDIQMPEMDGLDAIAAIRQDEDEQIKNIPIIAATALTMEGDKQRCLDIGANDYISKPLRLKELVDKIEALLQA